MGADIGAQLRERVADAGRRRLPLAIRGGGTKRFYGRREVGDVVDVAGHRGIVEYEPTELVLTARAGTALAEIEETLAASGQFLPFEPPSFAAGGTLGGAVAAGLSGPRRPFAGAVRDYVLGATVLTGRAEILRFGGRVMKNVAGFDAARLMAGAMGTLGVLLEISLKVLPRPPAEMTLAFALDFDQAIQAANRWAGLPLPLAGVAHDGERLVVRLAGAPAALDAARRDLGGDVLEDGADFWTGLRDHTLPFFQGAAPLWRLSVPPATPPLALPGRQFLDWGGAQRWISGEVDGAELRRLAAELGGHATLFRGGSGDGAVFQPLAGAMAAIQGRLRAAFDPHGILNPGRLYET